MQTKNKNLVPDATVPDLFDVAPTSLWLEDYSRLRSLFESWKSQGITDLQAHLREDPARRQGCAASISVLRVNQRTLTLYGASSFDELAGRLDEVLSDMTGGSFLDELVQLWSGSGSFQSKTVNYALDGRRLDIQLKGVVLPGHESTWIRLLL